MNITNSPFTLQKWNYFNKKLGVMRLKANDKRIVWKEKSDLELMSIISDVLEKESIFTSRQYQEFKKKQPQAVPSLWFIRERFNSWEGLLHKLGKPTYNKDQWYRYSDDELEELVLTFISDKEIKSQHQYEKISGNNSMPSLYTLRMRFGERLRVFFKNKKPQEVQETNFELLTKLKEEIVRLGLESDLSMTKFNHLYNADELPSADTIIRKTNKNWEELMSEIGYDYREIKIKKIKKNLKNNH